MNDDKARDFRDRWGSGRLVRGGRVEPLWMPDGRPVVASMVDGKRRFFTFDARGNATTFFNEERLSDALGCDVSAAGVPFHRFAPVGSGRIRFEHDGALMDFDLGDYVLRRLDARTINQHQRMVPRPVATARGLSAMPGAVEQPSPDGQRLLTTVGGNLAVRHVADDRTCLITEDADKDYGWEVSILTSKWTAEGRRACAMRTDMRGVSRVPIVRYLGGVEQVDFVPMPRVGEPLPPSQIGIFDTWGRERIVVDAAADASLSPLRFSGDGRSLFVLETCTFGRWVQLVEIDVFTGERRLVLHESREDGGFVNALSDHMLVRFRFRFAPSVVPGGLPGKVWILGDDKRFLWISARDGWRHIYLHRLDGGQERQLTRGSFPVANFEALDELEGWVYFSAAIDQQHPYDSHVGRVRLDGTALEQLTQERGIHAPLFSPDYRLFVDNHSSTSRPPQADLVDCDGVHLTVLDRADASGLLATGFEPPEEFRVPATDGSCEHHGVIYAPPHLDPNGSYPVIEVIYGGSFTPTIPRTYAVADDTNQLFAAMAATAGFVVFQVDTRGTPGRSREFQDFAVQKGVGQFEVADHRAALEAVARTRPWIDTHRVGLVGGSYGGFVTIRALLTEPDFYKTGYAMCPAEMYPLGGQGLLEPYLGPYDANWSGYQKACNAPLAHRLAGVLRIIQGTSDTVTPMQMTMRLSDAFFRSGRHIEMCILPERGHFFTAPGETALPHFLFDDILMFFQRHLSPGG